MVGPIPAWAIADCALLAWTLVISADQLDSIETVDFWPGVVRIAAGN
jgi:hypothetical protein